MIYFRVLLLLFVLLFPQITVAQTLDELSGRLNQIETRIVGLTNEYRKEEKTNRQRLEKIDLAKKENDTRLLDQELRAAYASAERLSGINLELNKLNEQKKANCGLWEIAYRKTTDELLASAEKEQDQKKRVQIGRKLQVYQKLNTQLCPHALGNVLSQDWRQLQILDYDGPQEIEQKISLLRDLSREIKIRLSHLQSYYQEAIEERKAKERAQEFIQEGTLFDNSNLRTSRGTGAAQGQDGGTDGPTIPTSEHPDGGFSGKPPEGTPGDTTGSSGTPHQELGPPAWQSESVEQIETDYKKLKKALEDQQTGLQQKINEFESLATRLLKK